jgi:hypothetical protein
VSEEPKGKHSIRQELARMMTPMHKAADMSDEWRDEALCVTYVNLGGEADLWFRPEDTNESKTATDLCWECPVRKQCLEWGSRTKQRSGVWGGQPASVRLRKGERPHDYESLVDMANPYDTDNPKSAFHADNLVDYDPEADEYDE